MGTIGALAGLGTKLTPALMEGPDAGKSATSSPPARQWVDKGRTIKNQYGLDQYVWEGGFEPAQSKTPAPPKAPGTSPGTTPMTGGPGGSGPGGGGGGGGGGPNQLPTQFLYGPGWQRLANGQHGGSGMDDFLSRQGNLGSGTYTNPMTPQSFYSYGTPDWQKQMEYDRETQLNLQRDSINSQERMNRDRINADADAAARLAAERSGSRSYIDNFLRSMTSQGFTAPDAIQGITTVDPTVLANQARADAIRSASNNLDASASARGISGGGRLAALDLASRNQASAMGQQNALAAMLNAVQNNNQAILDRENLNLQRGLGIADAEANQRNLWSQLAGYYASI